MSTTAYINGEIVAWARKRAGVSTDQLANDLKVNVINVAAWEKGSQKPSFSKAGDLAKRLRIPFGYLFLSTAPSDEVPLPDLRTETGQRPDHPSLELAEIVQNTLLKQQWYSDYEREGSGTNLKFVGTARIGASIAETANGMRKWLGLNQQMRDRCNSWEKFKTEFIRNVEELGILVMRSGVSTNNLRPLSVREFRGFAIVDSVAPLVFINARDAKSAQTFTLAHELVHIWLGESGVSNPNPQNRSTDELNVIEKFCNRVATELLVPAVAISQMWDKKKHLDQNIRKLVQIYRVSRYVVARQAYELDVIAKDEYLEYLEHYKSLWKPKDHDDSDSSGNFYNTFTARNSRTLLLGIFRAIGEHRLSYLDASRLLNIKTATLKKVADRLG
jgi:Zn-dependent peptidase ImmA (M78 family)/transcriptional regulator with XRE-family HTH domain